MFGGSFKLNSKPESSASNVPQATTKKSVVPDAVEKIATTGTDSAEGVWKITLNHKPPPGSNIIVFLPVCEDPSNGLIISPGASSAPQVAPALDFSSRDKQVPVCDAALDLSKKCISSNSIPPVSIKKEPEELKIVGRRDDCLNSGSADIKLKEGRKRNGVATTIEIDSKNPEPISMDTTLPILITDVRTEAPGAEVGAPEFFLAGTEGNQDGRTLESCLGLSAEQKVKRITFVDTFPTAHTA